MDESSGKEQSTENPTGDNFQNVVLEEGSTSDGFEPLFEESVSSDEDLAGIDPDKSTEEALETPEEKPPEGEDTAALKPEGDEEKVEEKAEETEKPEAQPEEKKEAESEKKEQPPEETEPDYSKAPPKGYVPLPAIQEARQENQQLKGELSQLRQMVLNLQQQTQAPREEKTSDFTVLSDKDFDKLVEDNPDAAIRYQNQLLKYEKQQAIKRQEKLQAQEAEMQLNNFVQQSVAKMQEVVPGIYEQDNPVGRQLSEFATKHGFDDAYLAALTNPATRFQIPGDDQVHVLGHGAVSLVDMINRLYKSTSEVDPEKIRSEIQAEFETAKREEIKKEITAELMKKLKTDSTGGFKSLSEVPGSGEEIESSNRILTEAEIAKLSPEEERAYLGG